MTTHVTTASDFAGPGETCSDATPGLAFANRPGTTPPNGIVLHGIQKLRRALAGSPITTV